MLLKPNSRSRWTLTNARSRIFHPRKAAAAMHRNPARFLSTAAAFGLVCVLAGAPSSTAFADARGGLFRPPPPPQARNYRPYHQHRRPPRRHRPPAVAPAAAVAPVTNDAATTCGGLAPGIESVPVDRIRLAIKPTAPQNDILNQLEQASAKADGILQASCPTARPLTPVGRLEALATRLQVMIQAVDLIRPPLVSLDQSLDDKQRETFEGFGPAHDLAELCKPETASFTALPVTRIQAEIQPTKNQKPAFDALTSAAQKAAQKLDATCPADMPKTLAERFDALRKRLTALNDAVNSMEPSLTHFYGALSDEQKARLNVISAGNRQAQGKPAD